MSPLVDSWFRSRVERFLSLPIAGPFRFGLVSPGKTILSRLACIRFRYFEPRAIDGYLY